MGELVGVSSLFQLFEAGWFTFEACRVRCKTLVVWSCAATSSRDLGRLIKISQMLGELKMKH